MKRRLQFNNFFTSVASKLQQKVRHSPKTPADFLLNQNSKTFFINPTTPEEVSDIISKMKNGKSSGPNSIPITILKLVKKEILEPLAHLINLSFSTGSFPSHFKTAKVIPIFKSNSRLSCSDYRPISLLSNINKIIETLMKKRLYTFLHQNNCFYPLQFGFRLNTSTNDALVSIIDNIQSELDKGNFSCGVFIDLKKGFDTVDHKILLDKLKYYGVRGLSNTWFHSYLTYRKQYVCIGSSKSSLKQINYGVPQGSVLGPLLFVIYINDLNRSIKSSTVYHFADDTSLIYSEKSFKKLTQKMNHDLTCLSQWLRANKLSLNVSKTELLIFSPPGFTPNGKYKIKIDGQSLIESKYIRYLGILIDKHLKFSEHTNHLHLKLNGSIGVLSKLRYKLPPKLLKVVYHLSLGLFCFMAAKYGLKTALLLEIKFRNYKIEQLEK